MGNAVKKTISLRERLRAEFAKAQGYWSKRAREKGILTEKELEKCLG